MKRTTTLLARNLHAFAVAALLGTTTLATTGAEAQSRPAQQSFWQNELGFVRLEAAEAGAAANRHPVTLSSSSIDALFGALRLQTRSGDGGALFTRDDLDLIAGPIARALQAAAPGQDVVFAVPGKRTALGLFSPAAVTTGRVFVAGDQLNLIVGWYNVDVGSQFKATGTVPRYDLGSRQSSSSRTAAIVGGSGFGANGRTDWIRMALPGSATAVPQDGTTAAPAAPGAAPGSAPGAAPGSVPAAPKSSYDDIVRRLELLDRLKRDGRVTEQEYQDRRRAILSDI